MTGVDCPIRRHGVFIPVSPPIIPRRLWLCRVSRYLPVDAQRSPPTRHRLLRSFPSLPTVPFFYSPALCRLCALYIVFSRDVACRRYLRLPLTHCFHSSTILPHSPSSYLGTHSFIYPNISGHSPNSFPNPVEFPFPCILLLCMNPDIPGLNNNTQRYRSSGVTTVGDPSTY